MPTKEKMTLNELLRVCARRWYVMGGILALAVAGAIWSTSADAVYWSRTSVIMLLPASDTGLNALTVTSGSLINFAASVEREINGNASPPRVSSQSATLYGAGVRQGHAVSMLSTGGQWETSFQDPALSVEVVGASEREVRAEMAAVIQNINAIVTQQQEDALVPRAAFIETLTSPQGAAVTRIAGNNLRAIPAILLLGFGVGGVVTVLVDRKIRRDELSSPL